MDRRFMYKFACELDRNKISLLTKSCVLFLLPKHGMRDVYLICHCMVFLACFEWTVNTYVPKYVWHDSNLKGEFIYLYLKHTIV